MAQILPSGQVDTAVSRQIADLLSSSWEARLCDLAACHRLATLAYLMAQRSGDAGLTCVSAAHLGNAERLLSRFSQSSEILLRAQDLAKAVQDDRICAFVFELRGSLHMDVGDYESCIRVLRRAEEMREHLADAEALARVRVLLGCALGYSGDAVGSVKILREAVSGTASSDLLRHAIPPLMRFLTEAGSPDEALSVSLETKHLFENAPSLIRLRLSWNEAKIFQALGAARAAASVFGSLRAEFLSLGMLQESALLSLDLALSLIAAGNHDKARESLEEAEPVFRVLGLEAETFASTLLREDLPRAIASLSEELSESQRKPGQVPPAA